MGRLGDMKRSVYVPYLRVDVDETKQIQFLKEPIDFTYMVEHASPSDWRKSAQCTGDMCYACEQQLREWSQRLRVYIPILHEGRQKILSQGAGTNSVLNDLRQRLVSHGSITNTVFEISRKGAGKRASYSLLALDSTEPAVYNSKVDMGDLTKMVPYEKQKNYYI